MDFASACIDREVIKYNRLQDELVEWRKKCFESKSFCTPPDTNAINFNTLWNEQKYKNASLYNDNCMLISVDNLTKNCIFDNLHCIYIYSIEIIKTPTLYICL